MFDLKNQQPRADMAQMPPWYVKAIPRMSAGEFIRVRHQLYSPLLMQSNYESNPICCALK